MAVKLDEIRKAAERVASSLGLEVVDVEFTGSAKSRTLCVYLEKDAMGRTTQAEAMAARLKSQQDGVGSKQAAGDLNGDGEADEAVEEIEPMVVIPERFATGELDLKQLSWLTHEDCAVFSRDFGILLDVEDLSPDGEYTLEASSPGLERKLSGSEDFTRFTGNLVKIQTFEAINNNRHWQGKLISSDGKAGVDATVTLDLSATKQNSKSRKTGVTTVEIALSNIEKAHLVPEF